MTTATETQILTMADLLERLGDVPAHRVRIRPAPGTATEADVIEVEARENRLCELVEGVLVEKAMGYRESLLAVALIRLIDGFVAPRNLGLVSAPDGMLRLAAGLVRIPDVSFTSWSRIPGGKVPEEPIPQLVPDLAIEVLSRDNSPREMDRKRAEYFAAGFRCVWEVDGRTRTVMVYDSPDQATTFSEKQTLDGGQILPGFTLPLRELFAELDRSAGQ